jgi:hypothetical protein
MGPKVYLVQVHQAIFRQLGYGQALNTRSVDTLKTFMVVLVIIHQPTLNIKSVTSIPLQWILIGPGKYLLLEQIR